MDLLSKYRTQLTDSLTSIIELEKQWDEKARECDDLAGENNELKKEIEYLREQLVKERQETYRRNTAHQKELTEAQRKSVLLERRSTYHRDKFHRAKDSIVDWQKYADGRSKRQPRLVKEVLDSVSPAATSPRGTLSPRPSSRSSTVQARHGLPSPAIHPAASKELPTTHLNADAHDEVPSENSGKAGSVRRSHNNEAVRPINREVGINSSQTTEPEIPLSSPKRPVKVEDDGEPIVVFERPVKRKPDNDNGGRRCTRPKTTGEGSAVKPYDLKQEDTTSSDNLPHAIAVNGDSIDLDDIAGPVDTPQKRRKIDIYAHSFRHHQRPSDLVNEPSTLDRSASMPHEPAPRASLVQTADPRLTTSFTAADLQRHGSNHEDCSNDVEAEEEPQILQFSQKDGLAHLTDEELLLHFGAYWDIGAENYNFSNSTIEMRHLRRMFRALEALEEHKTKDLDRGDTAKQSRYLNLVSEDGDMSLSTQRIKEAATPRVAQGARRVTSLLDTPNVPKELVSLPTQTFQGVPGAYPEGSHSAGASGTRLQPDKVRFMERSYHTPPSTTKVQGQGHSTSQSAPQDRRARLPSPLKDLNSRVSLSGYKANEPDLSRHNKYGWMLRKPRSPNASTRAPLTKSTSKLNEQPRPPASKAKPPVSPTKKPPANSLADAKIPQGNPQARSTPLRTLPLADLTLDSFRLNPSHKSNDFSTHPFQDTARTSASKSCLPGCIRQSCCGAQWHSMASLISTSPRSPLALKLQTHLEKLNILPPTPSSATTLQMENCLLAHHLTGSSFLPLPPLTSQQRAKHLQDARAKILADMYGAHKQRFERPKTPPGFWRVGFPSTQEGVEDRRIAEEEEREKVRERWVEARREGGRWRFRDEV
ncbi:MAG: hypothetical protein M1828_002932 [Chrysothrix sp. TS-e1954]|nr:MAG: hypothetical protein M1828_002932 [Chrysothrix sp. TS-e1954]